MWKVLQKAMQEASKARTAKDMAKVYALLTGGFISIMP